MRASTRRRSTCATKCAGTPRTTAASPLGARHEVFDKDYADPLGFPPVGRIDLAIAERVGRAGQLRRAAARDPARQSGAELPHGQRRRKQLPLVDHGPEGADLARPRSSASRCGSAGRQVSVRAFRHNLTNEIFFDPTLGLRRHQHQPRPDPARRRGDRRRSAPGRRLARQRPPAAREGHVHRQARTPAARWCWCRRTC